MSGVSTSFSRTACRAYSTKSSEGSGTSVGSTSAVPPTSVPSSVLVDDPLGTTEILPHGGPEISADLTPQRIVEELDRHIVGQQPAKRALAIALRNRWRRLRLSPEMREEVLPKCCLLIGSSGT